MGVMILASTGTRSRRKQQLHCKGLSNWGFKTQEVARHTSYREPHLAAGRAGLAHPEVLKAAGMHF